MGVSDDCVRWVCEYGRGSGFRLGGCVWGFVTFTPPLTLSVTVAFGPNYPIRVIILITLSIIIKALCLWLMIVEILQSIADL